MTFLKNGFVAKIKNSFHIMYLSFSLFFKEPAYLWISFLYALFTFINMTSHMYNYVISFDLILVFQKINKCVGMRDLINTVFYLTMVFIVNFIFNFIETFILAFVSLIYKHKRFILKDFFLEDSLVQRFVWDKFGLIFKWTFFITIINFIFSTTKHSGYDFAHYIGNVGSKGFDFLSFFIIPIIVFGDYGIIKSLKISINLIKKKFIDTLFFFFLYGLGRGLSVIFFLVLIYYSLGLFGSTYIFFFILSLHILNCYLISFFSMIKIIYAAYLLESSTFNK